MSLFNSQEVDLYETLTRSHVDNRREQIATAFKRCMQCKSFHNCRNHENPNCGAFTPRH